MAQLSGTQSYDHRIRRDLEELASNIWLGQPINGEKAGNFRGVFVILDLTGVSIGTSFGVSHELGEVPVGYLVIGTPTAHVITLSPGTNLDGSLIPWSEKLMYLKAPADTNKQVALLVWGQDGPVG